MPVRLLPDTVIDQIAAGEVVERPAAVVKELFENSLDAGARTVRVHLEAGGNDLVRITDDGSGMDRADALMCLERHATSKIRAIEDLVAVRSFGFRGEAIPSIASVSRFELLTRRAEDEVGTRVTVEGGAVVSVRDAGCAAGTEIKVRDLFFNVPVRRGFLRTPATELGHAVEAVVRQAMLRPDVDVQILHNGREQLRLPAVADRAARAAAVLGAAAERLRPVGFEDRGVAVEGLIGPPSVHDASSTRIYLFVNGRYVRDPVLRRGVRDAYDRLLPAGRHPIVVLEVRLPGDRVDVNVHPSKIEVRFRDPRDVAEAVAGGLREALRRPDPRRRDVAHGFDARPKPPPDAPTLPLPGLAAHPADDPRFVPRDEPELPPWMHGLGAPEPAGLAADRDVAERGRGTGADGGAPPDAGSGVDPALRSGGAAGDPGPARLDAARGLGSEPRAGAAAGDPGPATPDARLGVGSAQSAGAEGRAAADRGPASPLVPPGDRAEVPRPGDSASAPGNAQASTRAPVERPAHLGALTDLRPLDGGLAVAVVDGRLVIVDLDAVHREGVRRGLRAGGDPQRLLLPIVVTPGRAAAERLLAWRDPLDAVGVSITGFGPGEIAIKRAPAALVDAAWEPLAAALAAALPAGPATSLPPAALSALAAAAPPDADAALAACADAPIAPPLAWWVGEAALRSLRP
jgi:DNA mismatch repair protein MutL